MMWPFALKWRRHNEGGESLLVMSFRLYLTASEYHTFISIGFKDVCFQSVYLEIFCFRGRKTEVL